MTLANGSRVNVNKAFIDRSTTLTHMQEDLGEDDESSQKVIPIPFSYATPRAIDIIQNLLGADEDNIRAFFATNDFDEIIPLLATAHFLAIDLFRANEALKHGVLSLVFQKIQDINNANRRESVIKSFEDAGLSDIFRKFVEREVVLILEGEITAAQVALLKPAFYSQQRRELLEEDDQVVEHIEEQFDQAGQEVEQREDQGYDEEDGDDDNDDQDQDQQQPRLEERVLVDFYERNVSGDGRGDLLVVSLLKDHPDFGVLQREKVRIVKHNNNYFCIAIYDLIDEWTPLQRTIRIIDVNREQDIHNGQLHVNGYFFTNESHGNMYLQYFSHDKNLVTLNLEVPQHLTIRVQALNQLADDRSIETIKRIKYANKAAILLVQEHYRITGDGKNKKYTVSLYNFDGSLIYRSDLESSYTFSHFIDGERYYVSDDNILYYIRFDEKGWSLARYDLIARKNLAATEEIYYSRSNNDLFRLVLWYDKKNKRFVVDDNDVRKYFVFKDKNSELAGSQLIFLSDLKVTLDAAKHAEEKRLDEQDKEVILTSMMEEGMKDIKRENHISDLIQNLYLKRDYIPPFDSYIAATKKLFYLRFYKELQEIQTELSPELYEKLKQQIITKLREEGIDESLNNIGLLGRFKDKIGKYFS